MNVLSLFSGIGGLELGLERAGMKVVGQVEIDPFCRQVLASRWPNVPQHGDVRTCVDWWTRDPRHPVHVVAGGFPCQPFANAGQRRGTGDERWGWPWMYAVIRALRPHYVVVENVPGLLNFPGDPFGIVLGDLADIGFDAEWSVVSACSVGAPHARERLFLVAHANRHVRLQGLALETGDEVALREGDRGEPDWRGDPLGLAPPGGRDRVVDGLPTRLDGPRIKALGNAVVPRVGEAIGRMIMSADAHDNGDYRV